jgi:drug/metabolite transporter (DMT)-like permease
LARNQTYPVIQALVAALLFGASAPLAKLLLGQFEPVLLAALLYLGSGIGLLFVRRLARNKAHTTEREAQIAKSDLFWLAGAILTGGVAAPITLLFSLRSTPAATASLLLNFEAVATAGIALLIFREEVGKRALWSVALITISSVLLSVEPGAAWGLSVGSLGIVLACILWGIDNNFTRNVSAKDPSAIVAIKGLAAGTVSLVVAIAIGNRLPAASSVLAAMLLGCFSYGISIALFIHAMRGLGAARASAIFGTSPLAGVILSLVLFRELPNSLFWIALPLMAIAALLLLYEQHEHEHFHELLLHEHSHVHDDGHHEHGHESAIARTHSHTHQHEQSRHSHHHMPDIHHRHGRRRAQ